MGQKTALWDTLFHSSEQRLLVLLTVAGRRAHIRPLGGCDVSQCLHALARSSATMIVRYAGLLWISPSVLNYVILWSAVVVDLPAVKLCWCLG